MSGVKSFFDRGATTYRRHIMARSLKGKQFFICTNNGVKAIVEEKILRNMERRQDIERFVGESLVRDLPQLPDIPIFTFGSRVSSCHAAVLTSNLAWFEELERYIKAMGGIIQGGNFYVPFSNGYEFRTKDRKTRLAELRFVTSGAQFEETFGATPHETAYGEWRQKLRSGELVI